MSGHTVPHTAPKAEGLNLLKFLQPSNKKRVQCHRHVNTPLLTVARTAKPAHGILRIAGEGVLAAVVHRWAGN